jgi:hypothetical protein
MIYAEGDRCTYWCETVHPIVCESPERLYVDFEEAAQLAYRNGKARFNVGDLKFDTETFFDDRVFYPPEIMTVDEWFSRDAKTVA